MRIAVFDLDGTITRRDTLWPYLRGWVKRHPCPAFWPRIVAAAGAFLLDRDRGRLKARLIRVAMYGASRNDVQAWSTAFAASLGEAELCPGALAQIAGHRVAGDRLVLLSASVDLYVPDIGRRFGFDETICTAVAWSGDRLDGNLASENRRAAEKRHCVEVLRARHPAARILAYGNARSDFDHFSVADEAVLVNARPGLQRK
ncbi:MAG TPA: HAD-IB family phosphatase, partial [Steroidobacteraceae bacterium]|nr:HAD-IB family phosphatase [Steroidobacteraceae bacterium]